MLEEWRPIKGYEDYEVSNFGKVRSNKNNTARILNPNLTVDGFLIVSLHNKTKSPRSHNVHLLVARTFVEGFVKGYEITYIDGDRTNLKSTNLKWISAKENIRNKVSLKIVKTGEVFRYSKDLAAHLGVSKSTVSVAINGRDGRPPTYFIKDVSICRV